MTHTLVTVADAVRALCSAGKPVLVSDTCALLDLIRVPIRVDKTTRASAILQNASNIFSLARTTPPSLSIAIPPLVPDEWRQHHHDVFSEVKRYLSKLDNMIGVVAATGISLGISTSAISFSNLGMSDKLKNLSRELLYSGMWFDSEDDVKQRAIDRAVSYTAPATKGAIKDCIIYEHTLELFTKLRSNSFTEKCVFITSNTNDFCEKGSSIPREPIKSELDNISATLTTNWEWALHELGF